MNTLRSPNSSGAIVSVNQRRRTSNTGNDRIAGASASNAKFAVYANTAAAQPVGEVPLGRLAR